MRTSLVFVAATCACALATSVHSAIAANHTSVNAAFVSQTVPSKMVAGKPANVTLTFRNTGSMTWGAMRFGVACSDKCAWRINAPAHHNDMDPRSWPQMVQKPVGPGETYMFRFTIIAPTTPGTYASTWQMDRVEQPGGLFGQESTTKTVQVTRNL